jgi:hypothetical protein
VLVEIIEGYMVALDPAQTGKIRESDFRNVVRHHSLLYSNAVIILTCASIIPFFVSVVLPSFVCVFLAAVVIDGWA